MGAVRTSVVLGLLLVAAPGCSVIVDGQLSSIDAGSDSGPAGETCTFDAQCISFDPFNCNRVCMDGRCVDGPQAPDGTRCGMEARQHCIAGDCVPRTCGDGFVDRTATPPEYCDDGNDNPDDGCNNVCTRSCAPPAPANCDDGNVCNGVEMCMTIMDMAFCRSTQASDDGDACNTGDGSPGTCQAGACVAN